MNIYTITVRREVAETYEVSGNDVVDALKKYNTTKPKPTQQASIGDDAVVSVTLKRHLPDHVAGPIEMLKPVKAKESVIKPKVRAYRIGKYGAHNPMPATVVKEIYDLACAGGSTYAEIGKVYGVSKQTVENIKRQRYSTYARKMAELAA